MSLQALNENLTADGQSSVVQWTGGRGLFAAYGNFGGGTAKLQASPDDGTTWIDLGAGVEFSADGLGNFQLPDGFLLRVDLSGSTSPDLDVETMWFGPGR